MMLFRSARDNDLDAIHALATHSGFGLTTLPKDKTLIHERLAWSCASFDKIGNHFGNDYYLFVLEEPATNQVVGICAIEASVGSDLPFYSYKLSKRTRMCHALSIRIDYETLSLVNDNQGYSEVCTLFLEPAFRRNHNGLLLSLARFLFMAHYPSRFAPTIIAEMRGVSDEKGNSPFWESLGRHFFRMSFPEADQLTLSTNKQFIADLMPRELIYVNLLTPEAQAVIGKPHSSTLSAMNILLREGFCYNSYVDIFDAGPIIEAPLQQIRTVASSMAVTISQIKEAVNGNRYLLANAKLSFRATIANISLCKEQLTCVIDEETSRLLNVSLQDQLRIAPLPTKNAHEYK